MDPIAATAGRLEATAATFVRDNRLPGAAVGVVVGDRLLWSTGIGFADVAARRAQGTAVLHRIASITKTFTGTAIMQLRDEGRLHLDDPAVRFLPELKSAGNPFGDIEHLTIRRMLSHESGLQSEPPDTDWRAARYQGEAQRNLARAGEIGVKVPANTQVKYSNLAYQLLGEVVARLTGQTYVEYARTAILQPLGMSSSSFEPLPDSLAARRATGYQGRFLTDDLEVAAVAPTLFAEGGLSSCVEDLARWVSFQLREDGGPRAGAQVLAGKSLAEMHAPRYIGNAEWTEAWCIAWYAVRRDDAIWVQHSGALPGFRSNICFDPDHKVGAIALVNGVGDASILAMDLAEIARAAILAAAPAIEAPAPTPEAYRALLGVYHAGDIGLLIRLEWRDGKLVVIDPGDPTWRPVLSPTADPDVFVVEPGSRQSGEHAVFSRLADGRVVSLFLAAGTYQRLGPVAGPVLVTR